MDRLKTNNLSAKISAKKWHRPLLSIVLIFTFCSFGFGQAYSNYETSVNTAELSFEAIPTFYAKDLKSSRKYLKTVLKEDLNSNFITEAFVNYRVLKKQYNYLKKEKFDANLLRISDTTFNALPIKQQKKYLIILRHLENNFSISKAEYEVLKSTIAFSKNETNDQILLDQIHTFEQYIDLAFQLKYSKLEIFKDCTGYWKPESILRKQSFRNVAKACMNWKHFKNIYRNPLDYTSKTDQHGLKAKEALRRLSDIKKYNDISSKQL